MGLFSLFTKEIAIDLGTANTVILHENKVVVDEPSIIAMNFRTKSVVAVGKKALMMEGKTSGDVVTVRPLKNGVIADFQAAELMLREFIKMANMGRSLFSPAMKMVICIPSGITEVEERAVRESAEQAGAKEVRLIYEPMAAAIGSGIDVLDANGNMIIDIGGGTSEVAVIALGNIAAKKSVQTAGDRLNNDIKDFMRREHNLDIGLPTAEQIKINVGAAISHLENPPTDYEVSGRDLVHGIPRCIQVNYQEIATALNNSINAIEDTVMQALNITLRSCRQISTKPASTLPAEARCCAASTNESARSPNFLYTLWKILCAQSPAEQPSHSRT